MYIGRQVYEAEKSDGEQDIDPVLDNEEITPSIINEHLNNPLINLNIKVNYCFIIFNLINYNSLFLFV